METRKHVALVNVPVKLLFEAELLADKFGTAFEDELHRLINRAILKSVERTH